MDAPRTAGGHVSATATITHTKQKRYPESHRARAPNAVTKLGAWLNVANPDGNSGQSRGENHLLPKSSRREAQPGRSTRRTAARTFPRTAHLREAHVERAANRRQQRRESKVRHLQREHGEQRCQVGREPLSASAHSRSSCTEAESTPHSGQRVITTSPASPVIFARAQEFLQRDSQHQASQRRAGAAVRTQPESNMPVDFGPVQNELVRIRKYRLIPIRRRVHQCDRFIFVNDRPPNSTSCLAVRANPR